MLFYSEEQLDNWYYNKKWKYTQGGIIKPHSFIHLFFEHNKYMQAKETTLFALKQIQATN